MLDNLNLDNLRIRTKLVSVLTLPLLALFAFAIVGFNQRSETAARATSDEQIVAAAGATSALVAAMQHEAVASTIGVATGKADPNLGKLQKATDAAIVEFKKANDKLDLGGNSGVTADVSSKLDTLDDTLAAFKNYRTQPQDNWPDQLTNFQTASIQGLILYVQALASLTTTPEVVLPVEQLTSLLDYNLQTTSLSIMAATTTNDGESKWDAGDPSNRSRVYAQIVEQDKANAVLTRVAGGSNSPIKAFYDQSVAPGTNLGAVLTSDWQTQGALSGIAFSGQQNDLTFPSSPVSSDEVQAYVTKLALAATDLTDRTTDQIQADRSAAVRASRLYVLVGFLVIAIAITGAIWISRSITRRLVRLTTAADRLSHEQLPRLVDSLKNPAEDDVGYLTSSFSEIDVKGSDEIGQLAGAFNRIQGVAVQVATEQAQLLRKGIGDMFVNLARRNQSLLDRQIEFIDQLESAEEDPDQLENLFRLDHLATRMRRNAESLLVLAGAEPNRRRGKPVPLADVVRAAVGEVEDFARVDMLQFDEVLVASNAALDIAHLLSELMENAANFSPPDTRVEVVGHRTKAEGYVISVTDHGIGMSPEALAESNDLLARPPLVGLALSRSLGFIVIGRLAARFGIAVRLMPSPSSGTTAMVSLPPSLITDQPRTSTGPAELSDQDAERVAPAAADDPVALAEGTDRRPPARRSKAPDSKTTSGDSAKTDTPKRTPGPKKASGPTSGGPKRPAASGGAGAAAGTMPRRGTRKPVEETEAPTESAPLADAGAPTAKADGATTSGLTKRVPRAAGGQRAVPGGDGKRSATQNRRSPEEVRSMLSNYRSGMQKGRDDDKPVTPDGTTTPEEGGK